VIAPRLARTISVFLIAAACAACGTTKPARFYTVDAITTPSSLPSTSVSVMVGPVSIPALVDRPEFVVQSASNRVEIDEFNRWASPLSDGIAEAVAGDLAAMLGTPQVASAPLANFKPTYRVTIDVQRFDSLVGRQVLFDAVWMVSRVSTGEARSGRTTASEPVQGDSYDAVAAAHSRAIARMSGDIAAVIRAEEASQPTTASPDKR
jgi:uncharacterized lipoprotein YmbA